MKTNPVLKGHSRKWCAGGYSLVELQISALLLVSIMLGVFYTHMAGLKLQGYVQPKVENAQYSRETISRMIEEVRCANSTQIGTGAFSAFTACGGSKLQVGNALRIFPGSNTTQCIYYYLDTNNWNLMRMDYGVTNAADTIAYSVTNNPIFSMESYSGTTLTNIQNNSVLSVLLQMRRTTTMQNVTDTCQVRAKMTRRNIL